MLADILLKVQELKYAETESKTYYPRPSMAGPERCLRQTTYWAMGFKAKTLSGRAVQVFEDSSWTEEMTADLIRQTAFDLHSEQMGITIENVFPWMPDGEWVCKVPGCGEVVSYRSCHGHLDYIISDILGVDRLIEHKGLSMYGFDGLWKGEVPYDYLTQMSIYMRGLQQSNPDLKEGILLVKNKNQSGYLEYLGSYDNITDTFHLIERVHHTGEREPMDVVISNITDDAFHRFKEVNDHKIAGTLPKRQYDIDHWRCVYCTFKEPCWQSWAEEHNTLTKDSILEGELVDMVKYEREIQLHESSAKKERDGLRKKIKETLLDVGSRSGRAGDYIISWDVKMSKRFNKELLPVGAYREAQEDVPQERLNIRKIKQKEESKKRRPKHEKSKS